MSSRRCICGRHRLLCRKPGEQGCSAAFLKDNEGQQDEIYVRWERLLSSLEGAIARDLYVYLDVLNGANLNGVRGRGGRKLKIGRWVCTTSVPDSKLDSRPSYWEVKSNRNIVWNFPSGWAGTDTARRLVPLLNSKSMDEIKIEIGIVHKSKPESTWRTDLIDPTSDFADILISAKVEFLRRLMVCFLDELCNEIKSVHNHLEATALTSQDEDDSGLKIPYLKAFTSFNSAVLRSVLSEHAEHLRIDRTVEGRRLAREFEDKRSRTNALIESTYGAACGSNHNLPTSALERPDISNKTSAVREFAFGVIDALIETPPAESEERTSASHHTFAFPGHNYREARSYGTEADEENKRVFNAEWVPPEHLREKLYSQKLMLAYKDIGTVLDEKKLLQLEEEKDAWEKTEEEEREALKTQYEEAEALEKTFGAVCPFVMNALLGLKHDQDLRLDEGEQSRIRADLNTIREADLTKPFLEKAAESAAKSHADGFTKQAADVGRGLMIALEMEQKREREMEYPARVHTRMETMYSAMKRTLRSSRLSPFKEEALAEVLKDYPSTSLAELLDSLSNLTAERLKDICRAQGLPVSGTKNALIARLNGRFLEELSQEGDGQKAKRAAPDGKHSIELLLLSKKSAMEQLSSVLLHPFPSVPMKVLHDTALDTIDQWSKAEHPRSALQAQLLLRVHGKKLVPRVTTLLFFSGPGNASTERVPNGHYHAQVAGELRERMSTSFKAIQTEVLKAFDDISRSSPSMLCTELDLLELWRAIGKPQNTRGAAPRSDRASTKNPGQRSSASNKTAPDVLTGIDLLPTLAVRIVAQQEGESWWGDIDDFPQRLKEEYEKYDPYTQDGELATWMAEVVKGSITLDRFDRVLTIVDRSKWGDFGFLLAEVFTGKMGPMRARILYSMFSERPAAVRRVMEGENEQIVQETPELDREDNRGWSS